MSKFDKPPFVQTFITSLKYVHRLGKYYLVPDLSNTLHLFIPRGVHKNAGLLESLRHNCELHNIVLRYIPQLFKDLDAIDFIDSVLSNTLSRDAPLHIHPESIRTIFFISETRIAICDRTSIVGCTIDTSDLYYTVPIPFYKRRRFESHTRTMEYIPNIDVISTYGRGFTIVRDLFVELPDHVVFSKTCQGIFYISKRKLQYLSLFNRDSPRIHYIISSCGVAPLSFPERCDLYMLCAYDQGVLVYVHNRLWYIYSKSYDTQSEIVWNIECVFIFESSPTILNSIVNSLSVDCADRILFSNTHLESKVSTIGIIHRIYDPTKILSSKFLILRAMLPLEYHDPSEHYQSGHIIYSYTYTHQPSRDGYLCDDTYTPSDIDVRGTLSKVVFISARLDGSVILLDQPNLDHHGSHLRQIVNFCTPKKLYTPEKHNSCASEMREKIHTLLCLVLQKRYDVQNMTSIGSTSSTLLSMIPFELHCILFSCLYVC